MCHALYYCINFMSCLAAYTIQGCTLLLIPLFVYSLSTNPSKLASFTAKAVSRYLHCAVWLSHMCSVDVLAATTLGLQWKRTCEPLLAHADHIIIIIFFLSFITLHLVRAFTLQCNHRWACMHAVNNSVYYFPQD